MVSGAFLPRIKGAKNGPDTHFINSFTVGSIASAHIW